MEKSDNGKYVLENHLRTWSELRKVREQHAQSLLHRSSSALTIPERKRWGGCRGSYNDGRSRPRIKRGSTTEQAVWEEGGSGPIDPSPTNGESHATGNILDQNQATGHQGLQQRLEDFLNIGPKSKSSRDSQDQTSFVRSADRLSVLRGGRDGGGSMSGANSHAGSSDEDDTEDQVEYEVKAQDPSHKIKEKSRLRARADALGDQSDSDPDEEETDDNIKAMTLTEPKVESAGP
jgi:hypothetical protein